MPDFEIEDVEIYHRPNWGKGDPETGLPLCRRCGEPIDDLRWLTERCQGKKP